MMMMMMMMMMMIDGCFFIFASHTSWIGIRASLINACYDCYRKQCVPAGGS